jgi:ABC-type uncharacterized transport system permease subunit
LPRRRAAWLERTEVTEVVQILRSIAASGFSLGAPLVLAATGEMLCERAGVLNLGTEGVMLLGALAGVFGAVQGWGAVGAVGCAVAAGVACGLVLALAMVAMRANQIVTGIAFNLASLGLTDVVMRRLATLHGGDLILQARSAWLIPVAYLAVPCVWIYLHRTGAGLVTRAAGENPLAVETMGARVTWVRTRALVAGCVLAALGGTVFSVGCEGFFGANMSAGRGYIAVAIVYFANWNVWAVLWTTFLFGAADKCQMWLRLIVPGAQRAAPLLQSIPYVLTVVVLAVFVGRSRTPRALMKPYHPRGRSEAEW